MKNRLIYWASMIILLCVSCVDEPLVNDNQYMQIRGTMAPDSRTSFIQDDDMTYTNWVEGDKIGLYTDSQVNLPYRALTGGATTEFIGEAETLERIEGGKVWAYYPYVSGSEQMISIPYTSVMYSNNPVPVFIYSDAIINGSDLSLKFSHFFAYLRITVPTQLFRDFKLGSYGNDELTFDGNGIYIESSEPISCQSAQLNLKSMEMINGEENMHIKYYCPDINLDSDEIHTFMIPILPQSTSASIRFNFIFKINGGENIFHFDTKKVPQNGIKSGHVYQIDYTNYKSENEIYRKILEKIYQKTGGDQWYNNNHWMSELPIYEWSGVNSGKSYYPYIHDLNLAYNNLKGQLPTELALLLDKIEYLNIEGNLLTGDIPDEIRNHKRWSSLGWGAIHQDFKNGGGFNLANSGIYAEEQIVNHLFDYTKTHLKDIFNRNKLTQVINLSPDIKQMIKFLNGKKINLHLDYQSQGLETVVFTAPNGNIKKSIQTLYSSPAGINWFYSDSFSGYIQGILGYSYFYDNQGQLVHIAPFEANQDNLGIYKNLDIFLRTALGEPVEHPNFRMNLYTSTDYSMDGEVYPIQQATEGKGLDIVLMGEGFTDQHMSPGGHYESKMLEATEKIFSVEPYKSLRNRFNVYGVKVVSQNAEFCDDAQHAIHENNLVALNYAELTGTECPLIAVIYNTEEYVERSYSQMYSDGSCVTYIMDKIDGTLIHELCGHGIAWLADEYVEPGNEELSLPSNEITDLENYYWPRRWGYFSNIDYHNTPSTVRWAHILSDNRFAAEELGIYEGAYCYGYGAYRSSKNSLMKGTAPYFNAPSREMIYKAVMMRSEGDEWINTYDYEDFVSFDEAARKSYVNSRCLSAEMPDEEIREVQSKHLPPTIIKGSWRDELKKNPIRVPLK